MESRGKRRPALMNHQLVSQFLSGRTLSTLPKIQSLAMYLAGQRTPRRDPSAEVYHTPIWWHTLDMVRLVSGLAQTHNYDGGWLFGISLGNLKSWSESRSTGPLPDDGQLSATCRATATEIADKPRRVAAELLRPLMRDLSAEALLDQLASPTK